MDIVEEITEETADYFYFPVPEKIPPPVLHIDDGVFGYTPNKIILKKINLNVDMDSRVAIVGANGAGKSTFLKLLMGELTLLEGKQYRHSKLRISMFTQHHIDQLDLMLTPVEQL
jgi:ATP-binding cassette subfamily F protein 3